MIEVVRQYGRYGYRRIAALLRDAGWRVNDKRIEHLWRREGLKVPMKQPKKGRLWLNDGPAYGCGQSTAIMSGRMISSITEQMMERSSGP